MEEMAVFKSFLRSLMRQLELLEKSLDNNDIDNAKLVLKNIMEDTQKGIED